MAGIRTCDHESQVQRRNHYTTEPPMCISVSVCLSVCIYVCVYVCVSVCLSVCISVCVYLCLCVCVCVGTSFQEDRVDHLPDSSDRTRHHHGHCCRCRITDH